MRHGRAYHQTLKLQESARRVHHQCSRQSSLHFDSDSAQPPTVQGASLACCWYPSALQGLFTWLLHQNNSQVYTSVTLMIKPHQRRVSHSPDVDIQVHCRVIHSHVADYDQTSSAQCVSLAWCWYPSSLQGDSLACCWLKLRYVIDSWHLQGIVRLQTYCKSRVL